MFEPKFKTKNINDDEIQVTLNGKYEIKKGEKYFEAIEFMVMLINQKGNQQIFPPSLKIQLFPTVQFEIGKFKMDEQKCTICLEDFKVIQFQEEIAHQTDQDVYLLPCSHRYHKGCLKQMIGSGQWIKCPVCGTIFGKMTGDQPDGDMKFSVDKNTTCPGHPQGTIIIHYNMYAGIRDGKNFPGTSRTGYLPYTPEGKQVLKLLQQCFARKLTFTVGRSVTTGLDNQIVWNGIHHKTTLHGGSASFGYPDETYLKRVKQELAAKGIS